LPAVSLVRHAERRTWSSGLASVSSLTRGIHPRELSVLEVELAADRPGLADIPGATGEALVIVLEGEVEMECGGRRYALHAGDAVHFGLRDSHALRATGAHARLLWVARPPVSM
jgi:quercetin dioxygenase-like cupin family protein